MAYTKTVWETGDVITAEKLNNMEGGIENALSYTIIVGSGSYLYTPVGSTIHAGETSALNLLPDDDTRSIVSELQEKYGSDSLGIILPDRFNLPPGLAINGWAMDVSRIQVNAINVSGQDMTISDAIYAYPLITAYIGPEG